VIIDALEPSLELPSGTLLATPTLAQMPWVEQLCLLFAVLPTERLTQLDGPTPANCSSATTEAWAC
jgi:hypothetical protein